MKPSITYRVHAGQEFHVPMTGLSVHSVCTLSQPCRDGLVAIIAPSADSGGVESRALQRAGLTVGCMQLHASQCVGAKSPRCSALLGQTIARARGHEETNAAGATSRQVDIFQRQCSAAWNEQVVGDWNGAADLIETSVRAGK